MVHAAGVGRRRGVRPAARLDASLGAGRLGCSTRRVVTVASWSRSGRTRGTGAPGRVGRSRCRRRSVQRGPRRSSTAVTPSSSAPTPAHRCAIRSLRPRRRQPAVPVAAGRAQRARRAISSPAGAPYADAATQFLLLGWELLVPGGRVGFVLPQSVLANRDAAAGPADDRRWWRPPVAVVVAGAAVRGIRTNVRGGGRARGGRRRRPPAVGIRLRRSPVGGARRRDVGRARERSDRRSLDRGDPERRHDRGPGGRRGGFPRRVLRDRRGGRRRRRRSEARHERPDRSRGVLLG